MRLLHLAALAVTAAITTWALYLGRPVLLPLALAFICTSLLHPLLDALEARTHRVVAAVLVSLVPTVLVSAAVGLGSYAAYAQRERISDAAQPIIERAQSILTQAKQMGLPVGTSGDAPMSDQIASLATSMGLGLSAVLSVFVLTQFFLLLGLLERRDLARRLAHLIPAERIDAASEAATERIRTWFVTRSLACVLSGAVVTIYLWIVDVPGALALGVLTAALNYLPTVGAFLAAGPIVLLALATQGPAIAGITALVLFVNEQVFGNVVDPMLQGEQVGLSPLVVLVSLVAWGLVWGLPGAFVAIPLTLAIVSVGEQHPSTRPLVRLLLHGDADLEEMVDRDRDAA
jgi:predicted PurR-regulated permease PerM